jgi:hypothetical protein
MSVNKSFSFQAEAIRDTNSHNGTVVFNGEFVVKTLVIENGLNQTVSFQCQGSANADFSNSFNIGSSFDVASSTNTFMTCDTYIPYWRIVATCSVAPSSGTLTVLVFAVGEH